MKNIVLLIITIWFSTQLIAQYAPAVGLLGSTAISKDSTIIHNWAASCSIERGWINIADTSMGKATSGDYDKALGKADNATISLGDGGIATLSFVYPIYNGPSWDFVVFENSFDDFFLELAFVEVSSDGQNFFRFPAHSLTQNDSQITTFGILNTSKINNLAGKYRGGYGTPFDLSELPSYSQLNVQHITHIRIIDVVGSVDTTYGTVDTALNMINDPFPTPFPVSGFDLDAVGVIHQVVGINAQNNRTTILEIFPNPTTAFVNIKTSEGGELALFSQLGKLVYKSSIIKGNNKIDLSSLSKGIYFGIINTTKFKIVVL